MPGKTKKTIDAVKEEPKKKTIVLRGTRAPIIGSPLPPDKSMWSRMTIMIPRPRPDQDISVQKRQLKKRIKESGLKQTVNEMVEDYYLWKDDPNPVSARRKRRATLIFSKAELNVLVPIEIHKLVGDFEFLNDSGEKP